MGARFCLKPVPFGGELLREDFEQSWVHEPIAQPVHNRRLERVPSDGQAIRADRLALVACGRATEMRLADLGEAAAADAAAHEPRKQITRPLFRPEGEGVSIDTVAARFLAEALASRPDCLALTSSQSWRDTIARSGASTATTASFPFVRERRLPVSGSLA